MSKRKEQLKAMDGMKRFLAHAIRMHNDGKLTADELDEMRRHLIEESLQHQTMDDYIAARKDGSFDVLREESGQNPRSKREIHPDDLRKERKTLAGKIAADFLGEAWDNGHLDDATYSTQMRSIGVKTDDDDDSKAADAAWRKANDLPEKPKADTHAKFRAELDRECKEMDEYVAAREKGKSPSPSVVKETPTVAAPAEHAASEA